MKRFGLGLLVILSIIFAAPAFGQGVYEAWVARYNGPASSDDFVRALAVDDSGNVYVAGYSYGSGGNFDYATIKYSTSGNTVWVQRYNGPIDSDDVPFGLAVDNNGNVYVTGWSDGGMTLYDYATIKYSPSGDTVWVRRYNGPAGDYDYAQALATDNSGNIYVAGYSYGSSANADYATIKYSPSGDTIWVRRYNGPANFDDIATALAVDDSGNVYVTGRSDGSITGFDYATVKYSPAGATVWVRRYNGPGNVYDEASALAVDDSGNVYVTGWSVGSGSFEDYATIKYAPNGDSLWVRRYNGIGNLDDLAKSLAVDTNGNVYVTGYSNGGGSFEDYATIKYAPNGDTLWVRRYTGPGYSDDNATALAVDTNGNVYVTGWVFSNGSSYDYATIKYAPNGDTLWLRRYNGPGNAGDGANALVVDGNGNICVTGWSPDIGTSSDFATIKYVQGPQPLIIRAFSPVNLIVSDPNNDSISVGFKTIPGANYSAANDSIFIPQALVGDYKIKVVRDPLDPSPDPDYSVNVRIDGTADAVLAYNQPVPDIGESHNYAFTSDELKLYCISRPGDANADGSHTLSDVIATVNYIFNKSGCLPTPDCWFKGPFCRGNWNGDSQVTLSDVIRAVNYIFNKPGGPWNALPVGLCCLP